MRRRGASQTPGFPAVGAILAHSPLTLVAGCSRGTLLSSSATTSCISTRALWLPDSFCSTEKCGIQCLPAAPPAPALPTWATLKAPSGPVMPDFPLQTIGHPP